MDLHPASAQFGNSTSSIRSVSGYTDPLDSAFIENLLSNALLAAEKQMQQDTFSINYHVPNSDSSEPVVIHISCNFHFTKDKTHLIIKRDIPHALLIDVYAKNGAHFEHILATEKAKMLSVSETITDINGDGLNDLVLNWNGSTGCCLKAYSDVFLFKKDKISFSKPFEFINPTFFPQEKVIRGICYGHPGETSLYKYAWTDEGIDTLAYVSYELNKKGRKSGKILITNKNPLEEKFQILQILPDVPKEYKQIKDYNWFTGDL